MAKWCRTLERLAILTAVVLVIFSISNADTMIPWQDIGHALQTPWPLLARRAPLQVPLWLEAYEMS